MRGRDAGCLAAAGCTLFVLGAGLAAALWLLPAPAPLRTSDAPTVVLVVWDSVDLRELAPYGGPVGVAPQLERLAAEGYAMTSHPSTDATAAAVATLLTGRFARHHGLGRLDAERGYRLEPDAPFLAIRMWRAGYRTLGAASLPHLARELGPTRSFEVFSAPSLQPLEPLRRAQDTWVALRWELEEAARSDEPLFVFLHLADVRARDLAAEPGAGRWLERYLAPHRGADAEVEPALARGDPRELATKLLRRRGDPLRRDFQRALHAAAITRMDAVLGELRALLEATGRWPGAVVAVTGGRAGGFPLTDAPPDADEPGPRPRVPLVLRLPDSAAIPQPPPLAQDVDLYPTLLAAVGLSPESNLDGVDLAAPAAADRRAAFFEDGRFARRVATSERAALVSDLAGGERVFDAGATEARPVDPQADAHLVDLLERHPPLSRLRLAVADGAVRVEVSVLAPEGALSAESEAGAREQTTRAGRSLGLDLEPDGAWRLRSEGRAPALRLRLQGAELAEDRVRVGGASLAQLDLPLLPTPQAPAWPAGADGEPEDATVAIDELPGGRLAVRVGRAGDGEARAVLELAPPAAERPPGFELPAGVELAAHPVRDAAVVSGPAPLAFEVVRPPSSRPAWAFFLAGERVPAGEVRLGARAHSAPGELVLWLSPRAWLDPALYTAPAPEPSPGVSVELLDPPPPAAGFLPHPRRPDTAPPRWLKPLASTD